MSNVIVDYEILYKFPTYYDYCIYMASVWYIDGASPTALAFLESFAQLLKMLYVHDQAFNNSLSTLWNDMSKIAFTLIPLMVILSILSIVRNNADGAISAKRNARDALINLLVSLGLAFSCGFIASRFLEITQTTGIAVLHLAGVDTSWSTIDMSGSVDSSETAAKLNEFLNTYDGEQYNFKKMALYIFLCTSITAPAAGRAMQVIFIFMRVFLALVLLIAIGFVTICVRVGIMFLYAVSPFVFVISAYDEISWFRDMWARAFVGLASIPTTVGILLAMIMRFNFDLVGKSLSSWEAFKSLGISVGIATMIIMIQATVLSQLMNYSVGTVKHSVRSAANIAKNIALLPLTVSNTAKTAKEFAGKVKTKISGSPNGSSSGVNKEKTKKSEEKEKENNNNKNSGNESPEAQKNMENLKNSLINKYQFNDRQKEEFEKSAKDANRVTKAINKIHEEKFGTKMHEAAEGMKNKEHLDAINYAGGVNTAMNGNLIRNGAYRVSKNAKTINHESPYDYMLKTEARKTDGYKNIDPRIDATGLQRDQYIDDYKKQDAFSSWNKLGNDATAQLNYSEMSDSELEDYINKRYDDYSSRGGFNFDFRK